MFYGNLFLLGFWVVSSSSEHEETDDENHTNDTSELNLTESDVVKSDFDAEISSILAHLGSETNAAQFDELSVRKVDDSNVPQIDEPKLPKVGGLNLQNDDEPILSKFSDSNTSTFDESHVKRFDESNVSTANGISLDTEVQKVIISQANTKTSHTIPNTLVIHSIGNLIRMTD